jgi:hypothetical protein
MKGGFLDSLSSSLSGAWNSTKKASTDAYNSATGSSSASSYVPTTTTPSSTSILPSGGKKRRTKRGGYSASSPMNSLASTAGSFSGKTAQPQNWVGGKTKRRRHKHTKSCKHKKSRRR